MRGPLLVVGLVCAPLLLFVSKPLHIDDALYVWVAQNVLHQPLDFYGFDLNWIGVRTPFSSEMMNPPLQGYFLAAAGAALGFSEIALHVAMLLPAVLAAHALMRLARTCELPPLPAALLALWSPAAFVSSTTLMSEPWTMAFFCGAVAAWLESDERGHSGLAWLAALLAAFCFLSKYIGLALIPLLLAHGISRHRRPGLWAMPLLLPLACVAAYEIWAGSLYGGSPLARAGAYAEAARHRFGEDSWTHWAAGLAFLGGGHLPLGLLPLVFWNRRLKLAAGALVICLSGLLVARGQLGQLVLREGSSLHALAALQAVLFIAAGVNILGLGVSEWWRRKDPLSVVLLLWILGIFAHTVVLNWSVSVRALVPATPAISILVLRAWSRPEGRRSLGPASVGLACAVSLGLSLAIAHADDSFARSARHAAIDLGRKLSKPGRTVWFQGAWGFQYYAEIAGMKKVDRGVSALLPGDVLVVPGTNSLEGPDPLPAQARLLRRVRVPVSAIAATMSTELGAGFYSNVWGPLPFAFGSSAPEEYWIYRVRIPIVQKVE